MGARKPETFTFGGVDSRSNPANFPIERAFRCRNFRPKQSGRLSLRFGYTFPFMSSQVNLPIHSAAYYKDAARNQWIIYGQGTGLYKTAVGGGGTGNIGSLLNSTNPWGHFRANNYLYLGNGVNFVSWDGTTVRNVGVRAPVASDIANSSLAFSNSTGTGWSTTMLTGYEIFMVYYNPITGEVGNRTQIGTAMTVGTTGQVLNLSGLPNTLALNPELVKGFGRTNDGGQVPYWLVDGNGNRIVVSGAATTGTIPTSTIDTNQELPTRNGTPISGLNKFTQVGQRTFGARDNDINLYYTEDPTTYNNGEFVGSAPSAWAGNNIEPFPTGEVPKCLQSYRGEGWFHSDTMLAIWNATLAAQGTNPWRGPWVGGCAGQRAWVETPYGPVWLTKDKQLMSFNQGYSSYLSAGYYGPTPLSSEYEKVLLGQIGDQYISQAELGYLRDPEKEIDCLYVLSQDKNGNTVVVIHDYLLRDERSSQGQGYDAVYSGPLPTTLVGTGCTPRQNVQDVNGRERLWAGTNSGQFQQLEDGDDDGGSSYTGDYISLLNAGNQNVQIDEIQWQGDPNLQVSYSLKTTAGIDDLISVQTANLETDNDRYKAIVNKEARWIFGRLQLTSHPDDGSLTVDGEEIPVETYGRVNGLLVKLGVPRSNAA